MGVTQPLIRHHSALQGHSCTCISMWLMVQQDTNLYSPADSVPSGRPHEWIMTDTKLKGSARDSALWTSLPVWAYCLTALLSLFCDLSRCFFCFVSFCFSGGMKLCFVRLSDSQKFSKNCDFHIIRETIVPFINIIELAGCWGRWGEAGFCRAVFFCPPVVSKHNALGKKTKLFKWLSKHFPILLMF